MIRYLGYTLFTMLVWGTLLLDHVGPGEIGIFIALLYSFYAPYVLKRYVAQETIALVVIKFLGPSFYALTAIFFSFYYHFTWKAFLLHPILVAFALSTSVLWIKAPFPRKETQFFMIMLAFVYSFSLHPYFKKHTQVPPMANFTLPISSFFVGRNCNCALRKKVYLVK